MGEAQFERWRFALLVWGKACALCVLFMSFSGRVSIVVGRDYVSTYSFAACAIVALVFLAAIRFIRTRQARLVFALVDLILIATWCVMIVMLRWLSIGDGQLGPGLLVVYATLGRIATLFANIQWNFFYSLNTVQESARAVCLGVVGALLLYVLSIAIGDEAAFIWLVVALLASGIMAVAMELIEDRVESDAYTTEAVEHADRLVAPAPASLARTRLLYFGARVLYGIALGFLVSITAIAPPGSAGPTLVIFSLALLLGLVLAGLWLLTSRGTTSLYAVSVLPLFAFGIVTICFFAGNSIDMAWLCAMLAELAWSTQNLFQLPSYRRMTGMRVATFSYYEYAAQVIPFYLSAWIISSSIRLTPFAHNLELASGIGCLCLAVLMGYTVLAMAWHILRYHPMKPADTPSPALRPPSPVTGAPLAAPAAPDTLTPREQEIFALLAEGYSRPYIAKTLFISVDTVKVHAKHIYNKLSLESQDALIELAHDMKQRNARL